MPFAITFAASHELEPRLAREIDVAMCVAASSTDYRLIGDFQATLKYWIGQNVI